MEHATYKYDSLSTRDGFNSSLRHFNLVMDIIAEFEEDQINLADIINNLLVEKEMVQAQIKPVVNALLFDKYQYYYTAYNLADNVNSFDKIHEEIQKWHAVDIVLVYYHPELGISTINPKDIDSWHAVQSLKRNELLTIFVGEFTKTGTKKIYEDVCTKLIALLDGKKIKVPPGFLKGSYRPPKKKVVREPVQVSKPETNRSAAAVPEATPAKEAIPVHKPGSKSRMTPLYGITVTNELFHNGNVEAWKKIISSYEHQHQGLEVLVFYDGEKINDINTLFKWGKVKRGTAIMISVVGENIKNVAKLKRYLMQGASHRFEAFLKGPPNQLLKLF
jgi:hypothetical protein